MSIMKTFLLLVVFAVVMANVLKPDGEENIFLAGAQPAAATPTSTIPPWTVLEWKPVPLRTTGKANMPCYGMRIENGSHDAHLYSIEDIYHSLIKAGADRQKAIMLTAIGMAESGRDANCYGDEHLVGGGWSFSYGVFQIRCLDNAKAGDDRHFSTLQAGGLERQAEAAIRIAAGGYRPWSMYLNGAYRQFLPQVEARIK